MDVLNIETKQVAHLTPIDGLPSMSSIKVVYDSFSRSYFILQRKGLYQIEEKMLEVTSQVPPIRFSNLEISGRRSIAYPSSGIKLQSDENTLRITFSVIDFSDNPIRYAYRLNGNNSSNWIDAGNETSLLFSQLKSGQYSLEVKAYRVNNLSNPSYAKFSFSIQTPFYKTIWFILFVIAFINFLLYLFYRYRLKQMAKLNAIKTSISRDLHDDIGSVLSSISMYSDIAETRRLKQESHDDVLQKINAASKELVARMNDIVWSLNPLNDNMVQLAKRMENFAYQLLIPQGIQFQLNLQQSTEGKVLNASQLKNIFLIFKESMNNALKYAQCSAILVQISKVGNMVQVEITDNGIGFDTEQPFNGMGGNGLQNMKARAEDLGGTLVIIAERNHGTKILLCFPF